MARSSHPRTTTARRNAAGFSRRIARAILAKSHLGSRTSASSSAGAVKTWGWITSKGPFLSPSTPSASFFSRISFAFCFTCSSIGPIVSGCCPIAHEQDSSCELTVFDRSTLAVRQAHGLSLSKGFTADAKTRPSGSNSLRCGRFASRRAVTENASNFAIQNPAQSLFTKNKIWAKARHFSSLVTSHKSLITAPQAATTPSRAGPQGACESPRSSRHTGATRGPCRSPAAACCRRCPSCRGAS